MKRFLSKWKVYRKISWSICPFPSRRN